MTPEQITVHQLKCLPSFFSDIESGRKTFEIRKDDRGYRVGDILILREWETDRAQNSGSFSGKILARKVTYITDFEQKDSFVVMGITPI